MRNSKLKSVLQVIVVLGVLASLLLCLNGCKKKKPQPTDSNPTTESTLAETTADTEPTTKPTTPPPTTKPTETTAPVETTQPNNCKHVLSNWKVGQTSNCTTEGSRYKECTLCKEKVETEVIPKTDHTSSSWIVDKKANCTTQGKQHQECTQCKEVLVSIVVGPADHDVYVGRSKEATATSAGFTAEVYCVDCKKTVQNSYDIPAIGSVAYTYNVNSDGKSCTITGVTGFSGKELILPATLDGHSVTAIGEKAFTGKNTVTTVYIPKSVTQLGSKAFSGCYSLTNITYQGTSIQWNTVQKGSEWNAGTGNYTIYCTNTGLGK